ncbi:MAG TPA: BatD family protein [Gammaproteobacteria bacterium]|nr:BatD family protein [Gammaproteobacteria bacterium]
MVGISRRLMMALLLCGALFARPAPAAEATVDQDTVGLGQSFVLTIEAKTSDDPDLSPLSADFDVLGTSKRSEISILNGNFKKSSSWQINLMAKREGDLVIPPLKVGGEQTAALTMHVTPNAPGDKAAEKGLFMEVEVTPRDPYIQAQCLYTVRILADSRWDVDEPVLEDPKTVSGAILIKKLGRDKITRTTREGRHYDVLERVYAIYPQRTGDITIPPITFQGQISRGGGLLLDPFSGAMNTRRLQSEAVTLHVKPTPKTFTGKTWLPAKSLQIHETWSDDPEDLKAGEPATRTISLLANGLTASQLPEPGITQAQGVKTYADQPLLDDQIRPSGITGLRQQKIAVIANADDVTLPEIRVPWWNTDTDHMEEAVLPARKLHISAVPARANTHAEAIPPPSKQAQPENSSHASLPAGTPAYRRLAMALGLGWLSTALFWWWSGARQRQAQTGIAKHRKQKERVLLKAVLDACDANAPAQTRAALLIWARARWPRHVFQGLIDIAAYEPGLAGLLDELNRSLYSKGGQQWRGNALADALGKLGGAKSDRQSTTSTPALEPLFRT